MRSPSTLYSAFIARERGMVLDIHSFFICGSIGSKILVPTSGYSGKWMRWRWVEGWNRVIADERKIEQLIYNLYIKVHIISPFIYLYKYYKKWSFFISHHIYHIRSLHFNHTPVEPAFTAIPIPTTPQPNTQFRDKKKKKKREKNRGYRAHWPNISIAERELSDPRARRIFEEENEEEIGRRESEKLSAGGIARSRAGKNRRV